MLHRSNAGRGNQRVQGRGIFTAQRRRRWRWRWRRPPSAACSTSCNASPVKTCAMTLRQKSAKKTNDAKDVAALRCQPPPPPDGWCEHIGAEIWCATSFYIHVDAVQLIDNQFLKTPLLTGSFGSSFGHLVLFRLPPPLLSPDVRDALAAFSEAANR